MSIKISSIQGISAMSVNPINRWFRTNPDTDRNPLSFLPHTFQGTVAGYVSGGDSHRINIEKFPFASDANATDVGDMTVYRADHAGQSSASSGYNSGGFPDSNVIDKFPFASNGNATDVGDLTVTRYNVTGQSDASGFDGVSGYTSGGRASTPAASRSNVIDKFPFASNANATDVGDLTVAREQVAGQSSTASGYTSGGRQAPTTPIPNNYTNIIDKFPFASNANATDVGDLTALRIAVVGQSSNVSGYTCGGYTRRTPQVPAPLAPITMVSAIQKFPFASDSNATSVGNLTVARADAAGQSSDVSGYASGGMPYSNVIDKFPFATDANATDVADLTQGMQSSAGQQD